MAKTTKTRKKNAASQKSAAPADTQATATKAGSSPAKPTARGKPDPKAAARAPGTSAKKTTGTSAPTKSGPVADASPKSGAGRKSASAPTPPGPAARKTPPKGSTSPSPDATKRGAESKATSPKRRVESSASASSKPTQPTPPVASAASDQAPEPEPLTVAQLRKISNGLTRKDLNQYRKLLLEKRQEIIGDVESLQTEAKNNNGGNLSHMPVHMADVGSDNYEQEFTLGLVESERKLLGEINEALARMENRTYGVCLERGVPIGRPRLDAKPWAKYCIEAVREREKSGRS